MASAFDYLGFGPMTARTRAGFTSNPPQHYLENRPGGVDQTVRGAIQGLVPDSGGDGSMQRVADGIETIYDMSPLSAVATNVDYMNGNASGLSALGANISSALPFAAGRAARGLSRSMNSGTNPFTVDALERWVDRISGDNYWNTVKQPFSR